MATTYPTTFDTDTTLYVAKAGLKAILAVDPGAGGTTITVDSTTGFPSAGIIALESEEVAYAAITANSFTGCTRGYDSTTAAGHPVNTIVYGTIGADHHNALKDAIKALEAKVGVNSGGSTASSIDAGQLAASSSLSITAGIFSGLLTGAGLRDSHGAAGANIGGVHLGTVALGAGTTTFNIPSPTVWNYLRCFLRDGYTPSQAGAENIAIRFNGDVGANYLTTEFFSTNNAAFVGAFPAAGTSTYLWVIPGTTVGVTNPGGGWLEIAGLNSIFNKTLTFQGRYGTAAANALRIGWGSWLSASAITSLGFISLTGPGTNTLNGTIEVYGYY